VGGKIEHLRAHDDVNRKHILNIDKMATRPEVDEVDAQADKGDE
jgi:hypothetical protein